MLDQVRKCLKRFSIHKFFCLAIFFSPRAVAELHDIYIFDSIQKKNQFEQTLVEMRCLVCQNQNLADSNATLAKDLRSVIYRRIKKGESKAKIKKYLMSRYGNFISFKPVFSPANYCLWLSPFILLVVIVFIFFRKVKKIDDRITYG